MENKMGDIPGKASRTNRLGSIEGAICFSANPDYVDGDFVIQQEKMEYRTPDNKP